MKKKIYCYYLFLFSFLFHAQTCNFWMRSFGFDKQVDQVVVSLNRAAENAAQEAKPIFVSAIKNMTITDAINIVKVNNDAATRYLKKKHPTN